MPSTALKSLYGGKTAAARLAGNVGGQKREQTVLTPRWLLDELRRWATGRYDGHGYDCADVAGFDGMTPISLDPCTTPENPTGATAFCVGIEAGGNDGLAVDWLFYTQEDHGFVFVNPPYADLADWLKKCQREAHRGTRIYALVPWRSNREWFCAYLNGPKGATATTIAPIPFVGSKSGFPAPLCILTWNLPVPDAISKPAGTVKNPGTKEIVTGIFRNTRTWDY